MSALRDGALLADPADGTSTSPEALSIPLALEQIAARAPRFDAQPRFPEENLASLRAAGVLQLAADRGSCGLAREIAIVRSVAAVDASTARILDGHFNGVERLALGAPEELLEPELALVSAGALLLGVWGADPVGEEGPPASIERSPDGRVVLRGVKTFCSGAGGVQRALVVAGAHDGTRRLAYIDTSDGLEIDRSWYRASGLRSSESHRVLFRDTPVLALLGEENELLREPYFSRDAVRTAATWAGIADAIAAAAIAAVRAGRQDDLRLHAIGILRVALGSIDRWLEHATHRLEDPRAQIAEPGALAGECRVAIAEAARSVAAQAARACGARALVDGGPLDRCRRDLDLFLLQHRLDPKVLELGRLAVARPEGTRG